MTCWERVGSVGRLLVELHCSQIVYVVLLVCCIVGISLSGEALHDNPCMD